MSPKDLRSKYDIGDAIEVSVVVLGFIFTFIFLIRIGEPAGSLIQFQAQNGFNLLVSSLLSVMVVGLFLSRSDCVLSIRSVGPYLAATLVAGAASYLLAMFDLPPAADWLCLLFGFLALAYLSFLAVWKATSGTLLLAGGLWAVLVASAASGLGLIPSQGLLGLLVIIALAGAFIVVIGVFRLLDDCRTPTERIGYSSAAYALLMVWLATSRAAAGGTDSSYSSLDMVMAASGTIFGLMGAAVLAQKRAVDARIRRALAEGHEAYQEAEYDKAIKSYDKALAIRPQSKVARTSRADALAQMKRYDEAIKAYDAVLIDDREYMPAISGKGSTLRQRGDLAKSIIYLQRALNIDPDSKVAWNNKGNAFFFLDELKTAIYCYKKAIELDPTYSGAWYNLAVAYTNTGDFLEADYAFRTATNLLEGRKSKGDRMKKVATSGQATAKMRTPAEGALDDRPGSAGLELIMGDTEKRVLSHIAYEPGATQASIVEALTIGDSEAKAILAKLVKTGVVETRIDGTMRRFYPKEQLPVMIDVYEMEAGTVKERKVRYLTDFQRRLVAEVEANPGVTAKELAERMKVGRQVLDFHLATLIRGEVLRSEGIGGSKRYRAA